MLSKLRFSSKIQTTFSTLSLRLAIDCLEPEAYPKGVLLEWGTAAAATLLEKPSTGIRRSVFMMEVVQGLMFLLSMLLLVALVPLYIPNLITSIHVDKTSHTHFAY
jgi:hypothetical protein